MNLLMLVKFLLILVETSSFYEENIMFESFNKLCMNKSRCYYWVLRNIKNTILGLLFVWHLCVAMHICIVNCCYLKNLSTLLFNYNIVFSYSADPRPSRKSQFILNRLLSLSSVNHLCLLAQCLFLFPSIPFINH